MGPFPHLPKIFKKQCAMIIGQFEKKVLPENILGLLNPCLKTKRGRFGLNELMLKAYQFLNLVVLIHKI